jgi:hypothetical protein
MIEYSLKAKEFHVCTSTDQCTEDWNNVQLYLVDDVMLTDGLWAGIGRLEHWLFSEPSAHWVDVVMAAAVKTRPRISSSHGLLCMPGKNRTSLKTT